MVKNNSGSGKKEWFRFVVEFKIHRVIVADGGDLDNEKAHEMLANEFPFAYNSEIKARVIEKPRRKNIRKAQGYGR